MAGENILQTLQKLIAVSERLMHERGIFISRILIVLALLCLKPFSLQTFSQELAPAKLVPKSNQAYKDATFLIKHNLLPGCPDEYFNEQPLRTRYDFAVSVDRVFRRLKTRLLEMPDTLPGPYTSLGGGGVNLEELGALERLYKGFQSEIEALEDASGACETFLASLKEIATQTNKILKMHLTDFYYHPENYRTLPCIQAAVTLQAMGSEKAIKTLLTLARVTNIDERSSLFVLCRMLFTARGTIPFRSPRIGSATLIGGPWPLDPIEIVDGVPFVIWINNNDIDGRAESAFSYLIDCIQNCDWNKTRYQMKSAIEMKKALKKLLSLPKCQQLDYRYSDFLAQQIEETKK